MGDDFFASYWRCFEDARSCRTGDKDRPLPRDEVRATYEKVMAGDLASRVYPSGEPCLKPLYDAGLAASPAASG